MLNGDFQVAGRTVWSVRHGFSLTGRRYRSVSITRRGARLFPVGVESRVWVDRALAGMIGLTQH